MNRLDDLFSRLIADAYKSRAEFAKVMSRPGVSFTAEQESTIRQLTEAGDIVGAQKIILAELNKAEL